MPSMPRVEEQLRAILSWDAFKWALVNLPAHTSIDDIRFRDLISVTEEDMYAYVVEHGFPQHVVAERDAARFADDQICIAPLDDARWSVYYTERGRRSGEVITPSFAAARREVVHLLMTSARIALNSRYRLAHPDEDLPLPSEMD
jgi:hypothetical protein